MADTLSDPVIPLAEGCAEAMKALANWHYHPTEPPDQIAARITALEVEIAATPALSIEGVLWKVRIFNSEHALLIGDPIDDLLISAIADIDRMVEVAR